jgi:hypothetical protein
MRTEHIAVKPRLGWSKQAFGWSTEAVSFGFAASTTRPCLACSWPIAISFALIASRRWTTSAPARRSARSTQSTDAAPSSLNQTTESPAMRTQGATGSLAVGLYCALVLSSDHPSARPHGHPVRATGRRKELLDFRESGYNYTSWVRGCSPSTGAPGACTKAVRICAHRRQQVANGERSIRYGSTALAYLRISLSKSSHWRFRAGGAGPSGQDRQAAQLHGPPCVQAARCGRARGVPAAGPGRYRCRVVNRFASRPQRCSVSARAIAIALMSAHAS